VSPLKIRAPGGEDGSRGRSPHQTVQKKPEPAKTAGFQTNPAGRRAKYPGRLANDLGRQVNDPCRFQKYRGRQADNLWHLKEYLGRRAKYLGRLANDLGRQANDRLLFVGDPFRCRNDAGRFAAGRVIIFHR
jgi:hypothetical protein